MKSYNEFINESRSKEEMIKLLDKFTTFSKKDMIDLSDEEVKDLWDKQNVEEFIKKNDKHTYDEVDGVNEMYGDDDFISNAHRDTDKEIKGISPQQGWWVNFKDEYGDVWHEIESTYVPDDFYGTVRFFKEDSKTKEVSVKQTYYYNIRSVSENLPDKARIIIDKNGKRYE